MLPSPSSSSYSDCSSSPSTMGVIRSFCVRLIIVGNQTYLFKLVWNTQKMTRTSTKARCFLTLKKFWCLNALPYCFFLHIFLLTYNLRNVIKQIGIKFISKWWNGATPFKSVSIFTSFFMSHVGSKWNIYLSLWLTFRLRFVEILFGL